MFNFAAQRQAEILKILLKEYNDLSEDLIKYCGSVLFHSPLKHDVNGENEQTLLVKKDQIVIPIRVYNIYDPYSFWWTLDTPVKSVEDWYGYPKEQLYYMSTYISHKSKTVNLTPVDDYCLVRLPPIPHSVMVNEFPIKNSLFSWCVGFISRRLP